MQKNQIPISVKNLVLSKNLMQITEEGRLLNLLVLGKQNTLKNTSPYLTFAKQDLEKKDVGLTFVVQKKDMAYTLYAMALKAGRKRSDIKLIKPSVDLLYSEMVMCDGYHPEDIEKVVDYKKAIKNKQVIIIDMEYATCRNYAIRATAMLLSQLQANMQETDKTLKRCHYVYIEDAHKYLPFIELLLTVGGDYNISTNLFMNSRNEFTSMGKDYTSLVDNYVRNIILTNTLNIEDAEHYYKQLSVSKSYAKESADWKEILKTRLSYDKNIIEIRQSEKAYTITAHYSMDTLLNRNQGQILYQVFDEFGNKHSGTCKLLTIPTTEEDEITASAKKIRKKMHKTYMESIHRLSQEENELLKTLEDSSSQNKPITNSIIQVAETELKKEPVKEPTKELQDKQAKIQPVEKSQQIKSDKRNKGTESKKSKRTEEKPTPVVTTPEEPSNGKKRPLYKPLPVNNLPWNKKELTEEDTGNKEMKKEEFLDDSLDDILGNASDEVLKNLESDSDKDELEESGLTEQEKDDTLEDLNLDESIPDNFEDLVLEDMGLQGDLLSEGNQDDDLSFLDLDDDAINDISSIGFETDDNTAPAFLGCGLVNDIVHVAATSSTNIQEKHVDDDIIFELEMPIQDDYTKEGNSYCSQFRPKRITFPKRTKDINAFYLNQQLEDLNKYK